MGKYVACRHRRARWSQPSFFNGSGDRKQLFFGFHGTRTGHDRDVVWTDFGVFDSKFGWLWMKLFVGKFVTFRDRDHLVDDRVGLDGSQVDLGLITDQTDDRDFLATGQVCM